MEIISAKLVVVTPMFLGGSTDGSEKGQPQCAETIRGASVKGALRAAFRALNWSRLRNQNDSDQAALKALHREEADLFGAAAKDNSGGQSRFLLRVKSDKKIHPQNHLPGKTPQIEYLLGMGLFSHKKGMLRKHIPLGTEFDVELALKPGMTAKQKQQLTDAVRLFGLLGALGSRGRKGFGSVAMTRYSGPLPCPIPQSPEDYKAALQELIGPELADGLPPLTAFSRHTAIQLSARGRNAMQLLEQHGTELGMYRGYGRDVRGEHQTFSRKSEANFRADHDWAYKVASGSRDDNLPKRAVFGLPHPYHLSKGGGVAVDASTGRRASPLMAHIHRLPSGECLLVHTLYKSQFLPERSTVNVKARGRPFQISNVNEQVDWTVIDKFLQRFGNREVIDV